MLRAPHRRVTTLHVPPSVGASTSSHPIPSHPIPSHPHGVHARALRDKNPSRIPSPAGCLRGGMGMGGGTYTRVTTPQSVQSGTQTDDARFTRDVMTTDTVNHTFTTTIASSRALDRTLAFSTSRRRRRRVAAVGAGAAGGDVAGRHTSTDLATRAETTTTDSDSDRVDVSTYVRRRRPRSSAFARVVSFIRASPRIFARIHSSDARRARRGFDVERGGVRERSRG